MLVSEAVDIDGEGMLESEGLRLVVTSEGTGKTLVGETVGAVAFAVLEPAF